MDETIKSLLHLATSDDITGLQATLITENWVPALRKWQREIRRRALAEKRERHAIVRALVEDWKPY